MTRRQFGTARKLPSGRWQVRYYAPDGTRRSSPETYLTKRDALRYLSQVETDMARGSWTDPDLGKVLLREYAQRWLRERTGLRPRTRELYAGLLERHIAPWLGHTPINKLTPSVVRTWYADLVHSSLGRTTVAKAYRLLRTILGTAAQDELIPRNPCQIKGAGAEKSPERPIATVAQVYDLADAVTPRFRALVLLAAFTGARWGELAALTRDRLDLGTGTMRITETLVEPIKGPRYIGPPKTDAGRRTVAIPSVLVPELRRHLDTYAAPGPGGLVFCGATGAYLCRRNFDKAARWREATKEAGVAGLHFHDLRHTANTLAAATGASTRELMARMGHASTRAAMIYQHATSSRDAAIARALDDLVRRSRRA